MDLDDTKIIIRALLTSSKQGVTVRNLVSEFRKQEGYTLPQFGYSTVYDFLNSIPDVCQLRNGLVCPVASEKSLHVLNLVSKSRNSSKKGGPLRVVLPAPSEALSNGFSRSASSHPARVAASHDRIENNCAPQRQYQHSQPQPLTQYSQPQPPTLRSQPQPTQPQPLTQHTQPQPLTHHTQPQPLTQHTQPQPPIQHTQPQPPIHHSQNNFQTEPLQKLHQPLNGTQQKHQNSEYANFNVRTSYARSDGSCSSSGSFINSTMQRKLAGLMESVENMVRLIELPDMFEKKYKSHLNFHELGFSSLVGLVADLPHIFHLTRLEEAGEWYVMDSQRDKPESSSLPGTTQVPAYVASALVRWLTNYCSDINEPGVPSTKLCDLYSRSTMRVLDYSSNGFSNFESFLEALNGKWVKLRRMRNYDLVIPIIQKLPESAVQTSAEPAVPPITRHDPQFLDLFHRHALKPGSKVPMIDLQSNVQLHEYSEVCVAEVWTPSKFYIQLRKFKNNINNLMDELQSFYNGRSSNEFRVPDAAIVPDLYCAALYEDGNITPEWHRALLLEVQSSSRFKTFFIDYGTTVWEKDKTRLRFLHEDFAQLPAQAITGHLCNTLPATGANWTRAANKRFLDLVTERDLVAKVMDVDFETSWMSVTLVDTMKNKDVYIDEQLADEGFAQLGDMKTFSHAHQDKPHRAPKPKKVDADNGVSSVGKSESFAPSQNLIQNKLVNSQSTNLSNHSQSDTFRAETSSFNPTVKELFLKYSSNEETKPVPMSVPWTQLSAWNSSLQKLWNTEHASQLQQFPSSVYPSVTSQPPAALPSVYPSVTSQPPAALPSVYPSVTSQPSASLPSVYPPMTEQLAATLLYQCSSVTPQVSGIPADFMLDYLSNLPRPPPGLPGINPVDLLNGMWKELHDLQMQSMLMNINRQVTAMRLSGMGNPNWSGANFPSLLPYYYSNIPLPRMPPSVPLPQELNVTIPTVDTSGVQTPSPRLSHRSIPIVDAPASPVTALEADVQSATTQPCSPCFSEAHGRKPYEQIPIVTCNDEDANNTKKKPKAKPENSKSVEIVEVQSDALELEDKREGPPPYCSPHYWKLMEACDLRMHIVNVEHKPFVCLKEVWKRLTNFPSLVKIGETLTQKNLDMEYLTINRVNVPNLFEEMDRFNIPGVHGGAKVETLQLLPLRCVIQFLQVLGCITQGSIVRALYTMESEFNPCDAHWVGTM